MTANTLIIRKGEMMSEHAEAFVVNDVVEAIRDGGRKYNHYRKGSRWVIEEFSRRRVIASFRSLRLNGEKGKNIIYIGDDDTPFSDFKKVGTWEQNVVRFTP